MIFWLTLVTVLVLIQALMVAGEFALVTVDRDQMERMAGEGNRRARGVLKSLKSVSFQLSGAQFGITWTTLASGAVLEPALGRPFAQLLEGVAFIPEGSRFQLGIGIAFVVSTAIQMVIGELIPKNLAIAKPAFSAFAFVPPLRLHNAVLKPIIHFLNESANVIMRWSGMHPREELTGVRSLEELELLVKSVSGAGFQAGPDDGQVFSLLTRALELPERKAAEIMVPRLEVEAISKDATVEHLVALALRTGHSRFPVYEQSVDDALHMVHVKNVYQVPQEARATTPITQIMKDACIVPESRDLQSLFIEMGRKRTQLALVVDEYGGTAGILTIEDIVEEIIGEILDEYDPDDATPTGPSGVGERVLSGQAHREQVRHECGLELPEGNFQTLAGFLLKKLGHIPIVGEKVSYSSWELEVTEMQGLRIAQVKIAPARPAETT